MSTRFAAARKDRAWSDGTDAGPLRSRRSAGELSGGAADRVLTPLAVFLGAAASFAAGLGARDLWTTAEHRYAEVARELVAPGHDSLVPHLNGAEYADKPPGLFWVVGALHRLGGLDLAVAARIPSVVGGAFVVLLTFLLARRWWGTAAGLFAAGALATADLFDWAARSGQMDTWLSVFIVGTLYCFATAAETQDRKLRTAWTALGYLAIGAGIVVKGPAAVLIPAAVVVAFLAWTDPRRLLTWAPLWGAVLATLPGLAWLLAASARASPGYAHELLFGQAIGHATGQIDKLQPWHYYLWKVPLSILPWTLFLPAAIRAVARAGRTEERGLDRFLVAWLVAPVLVFSLSPAKRDLYLIAVHPAAALLVARLFRDVAAADTRAGAGVSWPRHVLAAATTVAGAALAAVGVAGLVRGPAGFGVPFLDAHYFGGNFAAGRLAVAAVLGGTAAACGIAAWRTRSTWPAAQALVGAMASLLLVNAVVGEGARDADQSPRRFLEEVRTVVGEAPLGRLGDDGGLQYAVNWVLERDRVPEFGDRKDGRAAARFLAAGDGPRYLVTDADELRQWGEPAGAVTLLRRTRRRGPDLVLLGNAAARLSGAR